MQEDSKEEIKRGVDLLEKLANPEKNKESKEEAKKVEQEKLNDKEKLINSSSENQRKKIEEIAKRIINSD